MTEPATSRGYIPKSKANDWRTPAEVIELLRNMWGGKIDLDPCAPPDPAHAFARGNFAGPTGSPADGLTREWNGTVFVNPPFAELAAWCEKCAKEAQRGAEIVLLLPARTDTRYWHQHVATADVFCFWKGRLTFVGAPSVAPFPVAFVYWGPRPVLFHAAFAARGMVVRP